MVFWIRVQDRAVRRHCWLKGSAEHPVPAEQSGLGTEQPINNYVVKINQEIHKSQGFQRSSRSWQT